MIFEFDFHLLKRCTKERRREGGVLRRVQRRGEGRRKILDEYYQVKISSEDNNLSPSVSGDELHVKS